MEVKTPTPDRLHVAFAVLGLAFVLIFSWVLYHEGTADWRATQARFRQIEPTVKNPHQLAYWAITVGTNIAAYAPVVGDQVKFLLLGGHVIGPMTLLRFYVLHCVGLPLAIAVLMAVHFWRVRKDGGISGPL